MKQAILLFSTILFTAALFAQPSGSIKTLPGKNTSVETIKQKPATTSNSPAGMQKQEMGSWYSGVYTSSKIIDGITVTKKFKGHSSVTEKYKNKTTTTAIEGLQGEVKPQRRNIAETKDCKDGKCTTEDRKISLDDQGYLTLDIASQITKVLPGRAFHVENYTNGSWNDFVEANRKPFRVSCSNPNIVGKVTEEVNDAREGSLRQPVADIFNRFSSDPKKQLNLAFSMYAQEIRNKADLSVRIGAGGYGFGFEANNLFSFNEKSEKRTFFVDVTKILYTIDVEHPSGGLFTDPSFNSKDIWYIASVSYGIRILASIELNITEEAVRNTFNAKYDGLLYGGQIDVDVLAQDIKNQATVKMYVVGGTSNTVTAAFNIADMRNRIYEMTKDINYHTCCPIRYTLKNNDGEIVKYQSATDWFKDRNCEEPGEKCKPATVSVKISDIELKNQDEDDVDLYGGIWANVYRANNSFKTPVGLQYDLLKLSPELHLKSESIARGEYRMSGYGNTVNFNFAAGEAEGAILYVYFNLMDEDDSPDDPIVMPMLKKYPVKNNNQTHDFYALKINLDEIIKSQNQNAPGKSFTVDCVDYEGDYPFSLTITVTKK